MGAGYISRVHADALKLVPNTKVVSVVDPNLDAARALASACGAENTYASVGAAIEADGFDCAHVLVPPTVHRDTGMALLMAGKPVLMEKPIAVDSAGCEDLMAAAADGGAVLGVNQNFVHHPAFVRLRGMIEKQELGRPNFVGCTYNAALRQMAARQFGHWMFHEPGNILLEQAVHPLSQIAALAGPVTAARAIAGAPVQIAPGLPFYPLLDAVLTCRDLPAQLHFAVGQSFPFWQITVVCDDGVAVADILANRVLTYRRTMWLEAIDNAASGTRTAGGLIGDSLRNTLDFGMSAVRLKPRSDPFFQSMLGSIKAFHAALDTNKRPELDGAFGSMLVTTCERMASDAFTNTASVPTPALVPAAANDPRPAGMGTANTTGWDVAILGGTGFIGARTVERFLRAGQRVGVMARSTRNLPSLFSAPGVTVIRGDIRDPDSVGRAIGTAKLVINLAHGGGGASYEQVRAAMCGGAETVARACLARGVERLIHVGSIASLYLGPQDSPVTGKTPPDPQAEQRADYARAKADCDRMLLDMEAKEGLPVCILRPGVVIGAGASPLHSGLGFFNNDQHCIGWNDGRNPLPFVLVDDVAEAIFLASRADGVIGKCYNLAGDVRLSAREYIADLAQALGRPLRFHPQSATQLWTEEVGKWVVKRIGGRAVPMPAKRDILSRGMTARFDCSDAKRDLGWTPVADREEFRRLAILVHAPAQQTATDTATVTGMAAMPGHAA